MSEPDRRAAGQAEVDVVCTVTGRGLLVLVKEAGFTGTIPRDGIIQSERGASVFAGPEDGRRLDASGTAMFRVGVIAKAPDAAQLFQPGDMVTFLAKA